MKDKHEEIKKEFEKLNSTLEEKKDEYLEQISNNINTAIKNYEDKELWTQSYDNIVDIFYTALTETYLETSITLKKIYQQISDKILDIEDFIYKDDKITLSERIKGYWNEAYQFLKQSKADKKIIALHLLTMYDRILNNEMINVKTGVKKAKRPINPGGIEVVIITDGECCSNGGIYLVEDDPELPPYHINCQCDFWYDILEPEEEEDLEMLQEAGWEIGDD